MAFIRAANLNWVTGQPRHADRVLAAGLAALRTPQSRAVLDAFRSAFAAHRGHSEQALRIAEAVLAMPGCPPVAEVFAQFGARMGQFAVEAVALHTAVRFGDRTCGARLRTLMSVVDGPRVQLAAQHAQAWADRDAAKLSTVCTALADAGLLLIAAETAAQGAVVHRESGDLHAEQTALTRARRLLAGCEGADTPALRAALRPSPLTEREREVAALVAAGYSNRQIAEHLVVSVRTVEGHVYRACVKLGVADRAALAELTVTPAQDR